MLSISFGRFFMCDIFRIDDVRILVRARIRGRVAIATAIILCGQLVPPTSAQSSQIDPTLTQISVGATHACALTTTGGVKCWGNNDLGQLGDNSSTERRAPVDVPGLANGMVAVSASENYTCALAIVGTVTCWGYNGLGQLGIGSMADSSVPVPVKNLDGVVSIVTGGYHACALLASGGVRCWGSDQYGQLGIGPPKGRDTNVPDIVVGLPAGVKALAAGRYHTCALTTGGEVKCWGYNENGQLGDTTRTDRLSPVTVSGLSSGVTALAAGHYHTCALTTGGAVKCWGNNFYGQLGDNGNRQAYAPVSVFGLAEMVVAVAASYAHTCVLTANGGVKCWGANGGGALGDNTFDDRSYPAADVEVGGNADSVATGGGVTCAVLRGGGGKCWGANDRGQLGDCTTTGRSTPVAVKGVASGVSLMATGFQHTCAVTAANGFKCWGSNRYGQLGNNTITNRPFPDDVADLRQGGPSIAAGGAHTCAVTSAGGAKCWGANNFGQLGSGTSEASVLAPVDVLSLGGGVAAVAAGGDHSCALTTSGAIKCWGANQNGQAGAGTANYAAVPVDVPDLTSGIAKIAAGRNHTCALTTGDAVKCWGLNGSGQLGNGAATNSPVPIPVNVVEVGAGVRAIAAGGHHTCAITLMRGVKCWGDNAAGQLGDGTANNSATPVDVVGLNADVAAIATGSSHTCVVTVNGAVKCWGSNSFGQLATGSTAGSRSPINAVGLSSGVSAIALGGNHTCALTTGAGLRCWGDNSEGQLGNHSIAPQLTPRAILLSQSIGFLPPSYLVQGSPAVSISSNSTSGLPISFDTWTPSVCTVVGNTVTAPATSLCGLRASQSGDDGDAPAPQRLAIIPVLSAEPLNVDGSESTSRYDAATDGVMLLRYLFGLRGDAVTLGGLGSAATRNTTQIVAHLESIAPFLDVDGDGKVLPTTDGIMILRRLLGFTGGALTMGVKNSTRSAADVAAAIDALLPP